MKVGPGLLDDTDRLAKREGEEKFRKLLREEEIKWPLRAKVRQVVQGDNNT